MKTESIQKSSNSSDQRSASLDDLTNLEEIRFHIQKNYKQNTKLDIKIDNEPISYSSIFVEIAFGGGAEGILMDTLVPSSGNSLIKESKKVTISYSVNGADYTFDSRYLSIVAKRFDFIKIAFPKVIRKIQKRKFLRVTPSYLSPLKVDLGDRITDNVGDISIGGLCFFTSRNEEELYRGKVFSNISFALPSDKHKIYTKAIVRLFVGNREAQGKARNKCGVEFIGLKPADEDAIGRYASERQRDIIRNTQRIYY